MSLSERRRYILWLSVFPKSCIHLIILCTFRKQRVDLGVGVQVAVGVLASVIPDVAQLQRFVLKCYYPLVPILFSCDRSIWCAAAYHFVGPAT